MLDMWSFKIRNKMWASTIDESHEVFNRWVSNIDRIFSDRLVIRCHITSTKELILRKNHLKPLSPISAMNIRYKFLWSQLRVIEEQFLPLQNNPVSFILIFQRKSYYLRAIFGLHTVDRLIAELEFKNETVEEGEVVRNAYRLGRYW